MFCMSSSQLLEAGWTRDHAALTPNIMGPTVAYAGIVKLDVFEIMCLQSRTFCNQITLQHSSLSFKPSRVVTAEKSRAFFHGMGTALCQHPRFRLGRCHVPSKQAEAKALAVAERSGGRTD